MLPKNFFENHFLGEQKNELFVALASDGSFNEKYEKMKSVIMNLDKYSFKGIFCVQNDLITDDNTFKIFDAIAHSRMLLFDLSDDLRFKDKKEINTNVIYELGVALTFRDKRDCVLIRKKDRPIEELPFDIKHLTINEYENLAEPWLKELLINAIKSQLSYKEIILEGIARTIDEIGYSIIKFWALPNPSEKRHFNILSMTNFLNQTLPGRELTKEEVRSSVHRFLDLGIVTMRAEDKTPNVFETAYHWTSFGKKILEFIKERGRN